jgi:hypothetical protein
LQQRELTTNKGLSAEKVNTAEVPDTSAVTAHLSEGLVALQLLVTFS